MRCLGACLISFGILIVFGLVGWTLASPDTPEWIKIILFCLTLAFLFKALTPGGAKT